MKYVSLVQIGAGGTGSWLARTLIHQLLQLQSSNTPFLVNWDILDYDVIEARNLLRQPMPGGVGENKGSYLRDYLRSVVASAGLQKTSAFAINSKEILLSESMPAAELDIILSDIFTPKLNKELSLRFIISGVDNTYTRQLLEKSMIDFALAYPEISELYSYVNVGVDVNGGFIAERIQGNFVCKTAFNEITLPDGDMSCAARLERGVVPQTVFSNIMAGAWGAQLINELVAKWLNNADNYMDPPIVRFIGNSTSGVTLLPPESYYM